MRYATARPWLAAVGLGALLAAPLVAQAGGRPPVGNGAPAAEQLQGTIAGRLINAESREPVGAATVRLMELARGELSHQDGTFHFARVPPGRYTVAVQRLGFAPVQREVRLTAEENAWIEIEIEPTAISLPGVVVTGVGRERSATEAYRPTTVVDQAELRRELGSSIAATLSGQPGISQRFNGPAAAQPVIRGLSGDRVLVLEDGNRTGDIASTSADHAITIEPLTAERIEVLRGPAGLLYGSNALGGVINIIREEVPRTVPEAVSGTVSSHLQSVNRGGTIGGAATGAIGHFAIRGELSGRLAGDTRTPMGVLPATDMQGYNAGAGTSWVRSDGYAGLAVRDYGTSYGVPGSFQGETIPGAHEEGVVIDLRRTALRSQAALVSRVGPFDALEWDAQYVRFRQDEIERSGNVGTSFGQLTATTSVTGLHRHELGTVLTEGNVGLSAIWQDHRTAGNSGSWPARLYSLAGFAFEELGRGPVRLQVGGRYDWTRVEPLRTGSSATGGIRTRDFSALSGSIATLYQPVDGLTIGASLSRAFRTPSIPELYSEGPHLADYSFNIGNPDLDPEFGVGVDLFTRFRFTGITGEIAAYRNRLRNYIFYAPTGRLDPRLQRFPVYQATGADAMLEGLEGRVQWEVVRRLVLDGSGSFVRGTRTSDDEPLPAMPPLQGSLDARYERAGYFVFAGIEAAAAQERVGEFEDATPGYHLWNTGAGLRWSAWGDLHTLTLNVDNVLDRVWYDHLSRIRSVAPQPGRNVELLYRVSF